MSGRGRPRKVPEKPGASADQRPSGKKDKAEPVKEPKKTNPKSDGTSKAQKSQKVCEPKTSNNAKSCVETPKASKSGEEKTSERNSERRDPSIEEKPSKHPRSPEEDKKIQESESDKTSDAELKRLPNLQKNQDVRPKTSQKDVKTVGETQTATTAESSEAGKGRRVQEDPTKGLQTALKSLTLKKPQISEAANCVNELQKKITDYLKQELDWCQKIDVLKSGSYYEHLKICEPDEFDFMLIVPVERVELQPFTENGAFYSVLMKRQSEKSPITKFINEDKLLASVMLKEIRENIKKAVIKLKLDNVNVIRKEKGCPAVTLQVKENSCNISIDFVLGLKVQGSWPHFTKDGFNVENWLGKKVKKDQKMQPFYLVPKYEGRGNVEQDGVMAKDAWRISFSHVEKYILTNHGNSKTCCTKEQKCCRKQCLKLLKLLLKRLKETHPDKAVNICSYHAKTTLFHACAAQVLDTDWAESKLNNCFQQLLIQFEQNLRDRNLPNFFIPTQNLFNGLNKTKCRQLADEIEKQRNSGFTLLNYN